MKNNKEKHADIIMENNQLIVSGELSLCNVMQLYEKSLAYMPQCETVAFDFAQVKSSDSAGLALIVEWVKCARSLRKPITFSNISPQLSAVAKASGIEELIEHL